MIRLPVVSDSTGVVLPAFDIVVTLESVVYTLSFRWNARALVWVMDVSTVLGVPLINGIALHVDVPLYYFPALAGPPGRFMLLDSSGQRLDPGLTDLGSRVAVFYATSTEVAAL